MEGLRASRCFGGWPDPVGGSTGGGCTCGDCTAAAVVALGLMCCGMMPCVNHAVPMRCPRAPRTCHTRHPPPPPIAFSPLSAWAGIHNPTHFTHSLFRSGCNAHTHTHTHTRGLARCRSDLHFIQEIGCGAEGRVWKARWQHIDVVRVRGHAGAPGGRTGGWVCVLQMHASPCVHLLCVSPPSVRR